MKNKYLYHYKMSRKKRSKIFIRMGLGCLAYIAGLYVYESHTGEMVTENLRSIWIYSFGFVASIFFYTAWWHIKNPNTYEAIITSERFIIDYPDYASWSFDVSISDIENLNIAKHIHMQDAETLKLV